MKKIASLLLLPSSSVFFLSLSLLCIFFHTFEKEIFFKAIALGTNVDKFSSLISHENFKAEKIYFIVACSWKKEMQAKGNEVCRGFIFETHVESFFCRKWMIDSPGFDKCTLIIISKYEVREQQLIILWENHMMTVLHMYKESLLMRFFYTSTRST